MTSEIYTLIGLFAGTFLSEDAACASAGLLASRGDISFAAAVAACSLGIFVSDLAIVFLGRAAASGMQVRWLHWMTPAPDKQARAKEWFARRGGWVVLASRFVPGTRSATCFAAGLLEVPLRRFTLVFGAASLIWTPLAVGSVFVAGKSASDYVRSRPMAVIWAVVGTLALGALLRLAIRASTWKGRRLLVSQWRRLTHWEFWPMWAVYPPVVLYVAWLALRHRSLTVPTAANPGMGGAGGLSGESKSEILSALAPSGVVPAWIRLHHGNSAVETLERAHAFMEQHGLTFPVVVKPDVGERGKGVRIVRSGSELRDALQNLRTDWILQAYVPGVEFGVFYYRYPSAPHGEILAITEKHLPYVIGDGQSTLETLLLRDDRAVCMAKFFLERFADRLARIPAAGEHVPLAELGTHCRGALFLDGEHLLTRELSASVDRVSRVYSGFHFGRYDVRAESIDAFRAGRFQVIELNGLTSEATSIYDPKHSVFFGWRMLCRQWRIAFEIGAENRAAGLAPASPKSVLRLLQTPSPL